MILAGMASQIRDWVSLQNLACTRNKLENAKPRGCYAADLSTMQNDFPRRSPSAAYGGTCQTSVHIFPILILGFHWIGLPILPPISKVRFLHGLILTQVPRPKSASSRFYGLFMTRDQTFVASVKLGTDSSFIISAIGLAPRSRYASPSRTITSAAGDRLL